MSNGGYIGTLALFRTLLAPLSFPAVHSPTFTTHTAIVAAICRNETIREQTDK